MINYKTLTLLSVLFFVFQSSACKLADDSSWNWNKEQLIDNSKSILLIKVVDTKKSTDKNVLKDRGWNYKYEVVETIKGKENGKIGTLADFQSPSSVGKPSERTTFDTSCLPAIGFEVGKMYLIFPTVLNPSSYDEIKTMNDPWLLKVKNRAKNLKK